ncbi:MAG TPA: SDR family NAD(P)-dependent oxidoreductase, partial [Opitutaceae bacterium]
FLQCRVPVIAAIQGHAQGGGLVFGLYADVVVMAEEGMYSAVFTKYGFTPGLGATFILGDKLGDGLATEMMMTAATYRGSELQQRGAGATFRPAAEVMATALGIAREMAQKPGATLRTLKHGLAQRKLERLPVVIADEVRMHGETFGQPEVKERIRHYIREEAGEPSSASVTSAPAPVATPAVVSAPPTTPASTSSAAAPTLAQVRTTMRESLCEKLHLDAATFDGQQSFRDLGLDSILGVEFIHGVNRAFGLRLDASIVYDFVNLDALSEHVAKLLGSRPEVVAPAAPVMPAPVPAAPVPAASPVGTSAVAPLKLNTLANPRAEKSSRERGPIKLAALAAPRDSVVAAPAAASTVDPVAKPAAPSDQIAIIGMACRLPGARDLAAFWRNLAGGVDSVTEVPAERWDMDAFYSPDPAAEGKSYCRKGGFIADVDRFDPLFFNLSHAEAEVMDPQQRLFLEEAWRAIEHAGYDAKELSGTSCGVFVGAGTGDYGAIVRRASPALAQSAFAGMGLTPSILAARISYFLNLKGPSVAIDTACSSSLVALHQACRSIQAGDCTMALAGGVSLILEPDQLVTTSKLQMLSPRGQCRPFDDGADGIALSEGVAVVVLKSLSAALADGDRVLGVIRASGINQDGKTNGITAPSAISQAELERTVYRRAAVNPAEFGMVEAHGTGTLLGDPVEIRGLTEAFRTFTDKAGYCALGSVKSNIGHTSFAAGVAGIIKTLLCFEHGQIPPSLNFATPNRHIDFAGSPFFVNTALREWPSTPGRPRLAAVSSFGYSGTNAHVVLSDFAGAPGKVKRSPLTPRPFARDRCWLDAPPVPWTNKDIPDSAATRLTWEDVRLREHRVRGEHWIAGSVLLERALTAARASGSAVDLKWTRPLVAREGLEISLRVELAGQAIRIVSGGETYAEGRLTPAPTLSTEREPDFAALHALAGEAWSSEKFYAAMAGGGLEYGPSYRLIERVTFTPTLAVSRIKRPDGLGADATCSLLLEALLQTPAVLSRGAAVPQEVRGVSVASPDELLASRGCLGRAERVGQDATTETYRLTLLAEDGRVLARIAEFVVRALPAEPQVTTDEIVYLKTEWSSVPLAKAAAFRGSVLVIDDTPEFTARLKAGAPDAAVVRVAVETPDLAKIVSEAKPEVVIHRGLREGDARDAAVERGFMALARVSQALLRAGMTRSVSGICVLPEECAAGVALGAVAKTIAREQPALRWKTVSGVDDPIVLIAEAVATDAAVEVRYRGAQRTIAQVVEFTPSLRSELPLRRGGTYLISGGAGGLGLLFARELREKWDAKVVLLGRSSHDDVRERLGTALGDASYWFYCPGDAGRMADVARAVAEARSRFGSLHGVLHTAGVLSDGFLLKKDLASAAQVLRPKLDGVHMLDEATAEEPLDFFVSFSSLAGLLGNVGQCDYAFANAYLDQFARERERRRALGERFGRSLSIQWPLWSVGGMGVAPEVLAVKAAGVRALDAEKGVRIFEAALRSGEPVLAAGLRPAPAATATALPAKQLTPGEAREPLSSERVLALVKSRFAELTKIPAERLEGSAPLERYGIDSLLVLSFTRLLEKDFGPLSKSLLFEHQTLAALAQHLAERYPVRLGELLGDEARPVATAASAPAQVTVSSVVPATPARPTITDKPVDGIAIIGLAGRYPGAEDLDAFWRNLAAGRDGITEVPAERWQLEKVAGARGEPGKTYNRWGGFLSEVDRFDAGFFRIPPREAESMDPQERLFLETAWHAVEDAGYARPELRGRPVGVFAGVMYSQYQLLGIECSTEERWLTLSASYATIANRVSYFFDWHGPSMAVDTMCSSSLTAIHLACDSLRKGESELALAGGVNLSLHPAKDVGLAQGGFAASDGRCRSFGEGGDGYVPGEGVGAVLLKPLAQALADGDHVYGVIRATALNHGGKTNGYTVPNPKAQTAVVRAALHAAGVAPGTISYVEAHGTGTALGDPIEVAALTQAWADEAAGAQPAGGCAIGSVKSNIGHLEAAAGIAGLTKVLLQLRHRQLAPSLHSKALNPHIDFGATPFVVQQACAPWLAVGEAGAAPVRRAGVSSFGAGGANAHLVVEEFAVAARDAARASVGERHLLVLSAMTRERLVEAARTWRKWIADTEAARLPSLADAAFTLQVGREAFDERLAFTAADWSEVDARLAAFLEDRKEGDWQAGSARAARVGAATLVEGEESRDFVAALVRGRNFAGLARWWIAGAEVSWRELWIGRPTSRVSLPGYRFARERHWVPEVPWTKSRDAGNAVANRLHPLLTENISTVAGVEYATRISTNDPVLRDHRVGGRAVLPGAATLELALTAARLGLGAEQVWLSQVAWLRPISTDDATLEVRTRLIAKPDGRIGIECSVAGVSCASATAGGGVDAPAERVALETLRARCHKPIPLAAHYAGFAAAGIEYGPAYRTLSEGWAGEGEVLGRLELPGEWTAAGYRLHPALVDGAFQSLAALAVGE